MSNALLVGIIGSLILVTGAAWPEPKKIIHPARSIKNWLFAVGALFLFVYAWLGYIAGGSFFFVLLELLVIIASILMLTHVRDSIAAPIILNLGLLFILYSISQSQGFDMIFFILGLSGIALGYIFDMNTLRRALALTIGSSLIVIFSYLEANWIFFWINVFFAVFSGYYGLRK